MTSGRPRASSFWTSVMVLASPRNTSASIQQRGACREAHLERLRAEVMVVEHEPGAMPELEQDAYGPEDVRITGEPDLIRSAC